MSYRIADIKKELQEELGGIEKYIGAVGKVGSGSYNEQALKDSQTKFAEVLGRLNTLTQAETSGFKDIARDQARNYNTLDAASKFLQTKGVAVNPTQTFEQYQEDRRRASALADAQAQGLSGSQLNDFQKTPEYLQPSKAIAPDQQIQTIGGGGPAQASGLTAAMRASMTPEQLRAYYEKIDPGSSKPANIQPTGTPSATPAPATGTPQPTQAIGQQLGIARNLVPGDSGADVKKLQEFLLQQGFQIPDGATGYYGPQTKAAVTAWQQKSGIQAPASDYGYFGPKSRAFGASEQAPTGTPTDTGTKTEVKGDTAKVQPEEELTPAEQEYRNHLETKTYEDYVDTLSKEAGLDAITKNVADTNKQLLDLRNKKTQEANDINNNPWISESQRIRKITNLDSKYQQEEANLQESIKVSQKLFDDAQQEIQFMAKLAIDQANADRQFELETKKFAESLKTTSTKSQPASVQEYEYAKSQGFTGSFTDYQNEDANRKARATGGSVKPATAAEQTVAGYAVRLEQAIPIISSLESTIAGMNYAKFIAQSKLPSAAQSSDFQQYDQASRNFINAILRRESGAAIAPSEFSNAQKQYLPVSGDNAQVLAQKKANRDLVFAQQKQASGTAYSSVNDLLGPSPLTTPKTPSSKLPADIQTKVQASLTFSPDGKTAYIPRSVWSTLGASMDALLEEARADGFTLLVK